MPYILITAAVFFTDFFLKKYIDKKRELGEQQPILKNRMILRKYYNRGMALDILERRPRLVQIATGAMLTVLSILFFCLLREKGKQGLKIGIALIIGGGGSNLADRLSKGHVVDYFSFRSRFPRLQTIVFNVSDLFIFLGSLLMLIFGNSKE